MEKRFLLFIFLSLVILTIYQSLVVKPVPKPAPGAPGVTTTSGGSKPPPPAPSNAAPTQTAVATAPSVQAPPAGDVPALVGESAERDVTVQTADVTAVFTNRGARLKSWRLKRYLDQDRHPQELVEKSLPNEPLPFTIRTSNPAADAAVNNGLFAVSGE